MRINISLLLQSAQAAFLNNQYQQGMFLLELAMKLSEEETFTSHTSSLFEVAVELDRGLVRSVNEDCLIALQGILPTQEEWGLYVICDGMGGHVSGQEAAYLGCQTILEHVFSRVLNGLAPHERWQNVLLEGIHLANQAIYLRNQSPEMRGTVGMGTTVTAAFVFGSTAYIANVGDSRTYLYRSDEQGLRAITKDHSVVAMLLSDGMIEREDIYTHLRRNQITRSLGSHITVEVDSFECVLEKNDILLLCSDGLWEMTRDPHMEAILASRWALAPYMAQRLMHLAKEGGASDNVSLIVIQVGQDSHHGNDIENMSTLTSPVQGLMRLVPSYVAQQ